MALDVRGSLKNTRINQKNIYVMVDELLSNAIDSYLIRKNQDPSLEGMQVTFFVEFFDKELDGNRVDFKITCADNGAGLSDEQTKAFVTKDTSYKDDLAIVGLGKCKGLGRIQFLHYFSKLKIDSVYITESGYKRRQLSFDDSVKEIDEGSFATEDIGEEEIRTAVTLDVIKPDIYEKVFSDENLREKFSADTISHHIMDSFLQRFVSLKESLGDFLIAFKTKYKDQDEKASLCPSDLPQITVKKDVEVFYKDANGRKLDKTEIFSISHYKLDKTEFKLPRNAVALCAKSAAVMPITKRYLRTSTLENNDVNGFYHIILIESDYLDEHVNVQRDNFDIPEDSQNYDMFLDNLVSLEEIYDAIDDTINNMLAPPDWDKEKIVEKVGEKYGISSDMIAETNVRIHYGDTEDTVVKRVLNAYQEQIIKDTSEIFDIKEEISQAEPHSEDFRQKVNDLAWKYTSSLKSIDMANLSQLVVRRAAIVEILGMAIKKDLAVQNVDDGEKRKDERIIHNIFFPMGKDSQETNDHDIWLLSEEYNYYDYIASDKPLSKIVWDKDQFLFESDIDEEMQEILEKNYDDNSKKRPDIALFNKEGSAIIIEFKAPGVNMDRHIGDLMEYAQLLAAKSNGRLKQFYGYLLGANLNPNRITGYTRFPNGRGWFGTQDIIEHTTGKRLGELYSEILYYEDIVDRANKRLDVYKKRLNVDLT